MSNHPLYKLGKSDPKENAKTLKLAEFVDRTAQIPVSYDFDKYRAKFPVNLWGNNDYGNCTIAARINQLIRLERAETKKTIKVSDEDVINKYKELSGCNSPGDDKDTGLVILDVLNDWRKNGWSLQQGKTPRTFTIDAYGKVDTKDHQLLRSCIYLFNGVQFGFNLPLSAQAQVEKGYWDVTTGPDSQPGSWGGHAVSGFQFSTDAIYVITWGKKIKVSNAFVDAYADEAFAVIDSLDKWYGAADHFDAAALKQKMHDLGISVQSQ